HFTLHYYRSFIVTTSTAFFSLSLHDALPISWDREPAHASLALKGRQCPVPAPAFCRPFRARGSSGVPIPGVGTPGYGRSPRWGYKPLNRMRMGHRVIRWRARGVKVIPNNP